MKQPDLPTSGLKPVLTPNICQAAEGPLLSLNI